MPGVTTAYQAGVHGSLPAANSGCILYACSTHAKVYRSDGTTWTDWLVISTGMTNPLTTTGDLIYGVSTTPTRLAAGTAGDVLTSGGASTAPSWVTPKTVATDTLWDAAGDMVQGSGADTAVKVGAGTAGHVWTAGGAGVASAWAAPAAGAAQILAFQQYAAADNLWTRTTASLADVDATNAAVTFTAPASGKVLIHSSFFCGAPVANRVGQIGLRVASSDVAGPYQIGYGISSGVYFPVHVSFYVTGLTPTTSYTYKLAFMGDGVAACQIFYGPVTGGSNPPFKMWVETAP